LNSRQSSDGNPGQPLELGPTRSPIAYFGGKTRLAPRIVDRIPADHILYCEPFSGAASVLFTKQPSKAEVINDLDLELVAFWRVIQHHLAPFIDCFRWAVVSRTMFEWEKMKRPETLTDIQRAARYYYLQRLTFAAKPGQRIFGTSATSPLNLNLSIIEETLLRVHWRLARVTVEHLDACNCVERYDRPTTFFYLDPPYYHVAQDYAHKFSDDDFARLMKVLRALRGRFLLTINDCPDVRKMFDGFKLEQVGLTYSAGNPRSSAKTRSTERHELFVTNY